MPTPARRENDARRRMVESVARGGAVYDAGKNLQSTKDFEKSAPHAAKAYKDWKAGKRKEEGPNLTDAELSKIHGPW